MAKYTFVVMSNPTTPAQEAEYNEWYNKTHIADVLNVPGFVAAQRFKLADAQFPGASRRIAIWHFTKSRPKTHGKPQGTQKRVGTADMVMSDAIDMKGILGIFKPVAERVLAKDVQRPSRAA